MTIESIVAGRPPQQASPEPDIQSFDERWAAWQAKGRRHDEAGRRRLSIVILIAGIVLIVASIVFL